MTFLEPTFPPLLNGRAVIKGSSPHRLAIAGAKSGELGAGDTLWLQDSARIEIAIILEPDHTLVQSAQMLPLGVAAAGDSLAALTPPQVAVHFRWPGTILLNGASAGECSLTVSEGCTPDEIPSWMVLNFSLRFAFEETAEPGTTPGVTALAEEGGEELTTTDVIESYSRHFLSLLDTWSNDGFADVAENWRGRAEGTDEAIEIHHPSGLINARVLGLDEDGNLLVKPQAVGSTISLPLTDCLTREPSDHRQ